MTRRDTADIERPHFYSQFWIDVAGGKRDVEAAAPPTEVDEFAEEELEPLPEPVKPAPKARTKAPERAPEPVRPTITSLADLANIDLLMKSSAEMDADTVPDIEAGATSDLGPFGTTSETEEPAIVTDFDIDHVEEEPLAADEAEPEFEDLEFDEEEEDEWGGGRKPQRPQRPSRKREPRERRGF